MASLEVTVSIDRVQEALDEKGFEDVYATHYDGTPSQMIVLHDDSGRVAHGEEEAFTRIIEQSDDLNSFWNILEESGMIRTAALANA